MIAVYMTRFGRFLCILRNYIAISKYYIESDFPLPLKEVLLDIQYNTGNLNQQNWPKLYKAIREKNVWGKEGIVENVNRRDVAQKRNNWTRDTARSIRF